jgi:hypothetical protein
LSAIRQSRVGESTLSTAQKLRIDYGARRAAVSSPPELSYQIIASNFSLDNLNDRFPRVWRFGLRPSVFDVDLRYRGEKLIFVRYSIGSAVFTSSGKIEDLLAETLVEEDRGSEQQPTFRAAYRTRPALGGWANETQVLFGGLLTSKATPEERDADGWEDGTACRFDPVRSLVRASTYSIPVSASITGVEVIPTSGTIKGHSTSSAGTVVTPFLRKFTRQSGEAGWP